MNPSLSALRTKSPSQYPNDRASMIMIHYHYHYHQCTSCLIEFISLVLLLLVHTYPYKHVPISHLENDPHFSKTYHMSRINTSSFSFWHKTEPQNWFNIVLCVLVYRLPILTSKITKRGYCIHRTQFHLYVYLWKYIEVGLVKDELMNELLFGIMVAISESPWSTVIL